MRNINIDENAGETSAVVWRPFPDPDPSSIWSRTSLIPSLVMVAVLALAAVLRFHRLSQRGLIYWDEGKFALEGERFYAYLKTLLGGSAPLSMGKSIGTAKPTHDLLIGVGYLVFGIHDYTSLYVDAAFSLASIALVYFIGRKLFGPWAGVIGAVFLSVSEYDLIYARSALSESDATFLLLLGVLFWVIDWERIRAEPKPTGAPTYYLLAGAVCLGLAFTSNYRISVYAGVLIVFDMLWSWNEFGLKSVFRRCASWIMGLAVFPLAWQCIDIVAHRSHRVLFKAEVRANASGLLCRRTFPGKVESYLVQAWFQMRCGKQSGLSFDPTLALRWFVTREGWVVSLLVLVSIVFALRTHLFPWVFLAAMTVVPYLFTSIAPFVVPRDLAEAIPFASLAAASALVASAERLPGDPARRITQVALTLLVVVLSFGSDWQLTHVRSGFAQAAQYLSHRTKTILANNEVMKFYYPGSPRTTVCAAYPLPASPRRLATDYAAGFRFVVIANVEEGLHHRPSRSMRTAWRHGTLLMSYPRFGNIDIGENPVATENGFSPGPAPKGAVRVLLLNGRSLAIPHGHHVSQCWRDRPT